MTFLRGASPWMAMCAAGWLLLPAGRCEGYELSAASVLGGSGDDSVRGARLLSDGTVVLAANLGSASPGGVTPILLNGADASAGGALVRLDAQGRTVLSVTRLAGQVNDLAVDGSDHLYVAMHDAGFAKVSPAADAVVWVKPVPAGSYGWRIDASRDGHCATLEHNDADVAQNNPGGGTLHLYDGSGAEVTMAGGYHNTLDVCVDPVSQNILTTGWRQASVSGTPVQISYVRGIGFGGMVSWTSYDWSTDSGSDRFINRPTNNMADTRGTRCSVGGDGKLYVAFQSAGGNHIFRYDPFSITQRVDIVGGDLFHEWFNTASEHKTFFARYEPATGAYLRGQQFCTRLGSSGRGNTAVPSEIVADTQGRVLLAGKSAWGLPLPPHPRLSLEAGETALNPAICGDYIGGAWVLVMDPDFRLREFCTRLTPDGETYAVDARQVGDRWAMVFGGRSGASTQTFTEHAIQANWGGGEEDGFFAVIPAAGVGGGTTTGPGSTTSGGGTGSSGGASSAGSGVSSGGGATSGSSSGGIGTSGGGSGSSGAGNSGSGSGGGGTLARLPWRVDVRKPRPGKPVRLEPGPTVRGLVLETGLGRGATGVVVEVALTVSNAGGTGQPEFRRADRVSKIGKKGGAKFKAKAVQASGTGSNLVLWVRASTNFGVATTETNTRALRAR